MVRYRLTASGRVQGVGFRWFVRERAKAFDLTGWVRNEYDGTVSIEVQGEQYRVDAFLAVLRQGDGWIDVRELEVGRIEPIPEEGFRVRY